MVYRIDGGGFVRRPEREPVKAAPPKPVENKTAKPTGEGVYKKANLTQQGEFQRAKIEREYQRQEPVAPPPTPEQNARAAAQEVERTYNSCPTDGRTPAEHASQKLRETTETQTPEEAALTLQYAKPTIDRIAADLGRIAGDEDGGFGDSKPKFDNIISDLAAASGKAASAPNGKAVVEEMAKSLVANINGDEIGRFDEALGKPIASGAGGELTAEVISQLQAAGRIDQADDILQNVEDAVNNLHDRAGDLADEVQKYNEELSWLVQQWQPLMSEEQLNNAVQAYKDENPEYVQALEEIDQGAVAALRALDAFGGAEGAFDGLDHADDVAGALENLFNDSKTKSLLAQSTGVTAEIDRLMQKAENNPNEPSFFDRVSEIAGKIDDGEFLTETVLNKAFDATLDNAFDAAKAKDYAAVDRYLGRLEKSADSLGFTEPRFKGVIQQLGRISRATSQQEVETDLRVLARKIDSYRRDQPDVFSNNSQLTDKVRRMGVVLGAVGTGAAINQAIDDPSAQNIAGALFDAAGLATDVAQLDVVKNVLQNKSWFQGLPVEKLGRVFGGLSLALDAFSIASDIKNGDYASAGFSTAGAAGGAMMIFGGAAVTGVGAVIVGAAIVGKLLWDNTQEANKHETDGARAFLQGAGIDADVANHLINNDDDGRSPAPIFAALAENLGVEPQEFLNYLSQLSPDEAIKLVETAHGVDPGDNGVYPVEKDQPVYSGGRAGYYGSPNPNDLNDLAEWMRENGYADAPGL